MGSKYGDSYLTDAAGAVIDKSAFPATAYTDPDPKLVMTADVYEDYKLLNAKDGADTGRRLKFKNGQIIRTSERDAAYVAATIAAITPDTGTTAGGTAIVITGTNLHGTASVTFAGTAGTAFSVVDDETIHVTTPAHAAGAVDVVVTDDAGNVTATGGFTYA